MSGQKIVTPSAEGLAAAARAATGKAMPPVHLWSPPFCGDLDMRIARDGTWFYQGTPIGRFELVKLFSGILRKDGDKYFLVTPVEKVGIIVDDAPFVAVDCEASGEGSDQTLIFETQVGDLALAGPDNSIDRKTFYRLVERGAHHTHGGQNWFGLWSAGVFFPVIPSGELEG